MRQTICMKHIQTQEKERVRDTEMKRRERGSSGCTNSFRQGEEKEMHMDTGCRIMIYDRCYDRCRKRRHLIILHTSYGVPRPHSL